MRCRLARLCCRRITASGPSWPPHGMRWAIPHVVPGLGDLLPCNWEGPMGMGRCSAWKPMAALTTASIKYAMPCLQRRSCLANCGSRAIRPSSFVGRATPWWWMACVTPRCTVVSIIWMGFPGRKCGVLAPSVARSTDLRGCTRSPQALW